MEAHPEESRKKVYENFGYFDGIFEQIRQGNQDVEKAFGLNVHWGYWDRPKQADLSIDDFVSASRRMTRKVYSHANLSDGMRVLDAGCGFGGTLFEVNEDHSNMDLVGLNIDPRQLARARELAKPKNNNKISFVEGDACELPFPDASFDVVLAVECIFHFPSRMRFFKEAHRVLKKRGRLVVSDFVVSGPRIPALLIRTLPLLKALPKLKIGQNSATTKAAYRLTAALAGFKDIRITDISAHTMPTYPFLEKLNKASPLTWPGADASVDGTQLIRYLEFCHRYRLMRYDVMKFRK